MSEVLRVGVVGCGVGREHVRSFQKLPNLFDVRVICDVDKDKAKQVANQFSVPQYTDEIESLYHRNDLDIIDICTPPYQHYGQIITTLSSSKHVICEKPLVGSLHEVDKIMQACSIHGKTVMPILQYRFGHGLQKLKYLLELGITGKLYSSTVEMAWYRGAEYYAIPWRGKWATELGGTLLNHAVHQIDMLCYIAGPVQNVFARTASLIHQIQVEDTASVSFEMADGSLATLSATLGSVSEISRLRFCFSNLTAESNSLPYANSDDPWNFTGNTEYINQRTKSTLDQFQPGLSSFDEQFTQYYTALQEKTELPVTLDDARNLLEIITAIYMSAQTRRPVDLPITKRYSQYNGWAPENI
jgi:predicted dehydrogenase